MYNKVTQEAHIENSTHSAGVHARTNDCMAPPLETCVLLHTQLEIVASITDTPLKVVRVVLDVSQSLCTASLRFTLTHTYTL